MGEEVFLWGAKEEYEWILGYERLFQLEIDGWMGVKLYL